MNANDKFYARDAHVDAASVAPLPNSRKIYVEGSRPDIRVPMREITQSDTPASFGAEKNPPIVVYDTSGPYTDPDAKIARMKVGTTHLAYKPEHAVDLDTGVIVAAPIHEADKGDVDALFRDIES